VVALMSDLAPLHLSHLGVLPAALILFAIGDLLGYASPSRPARRSCRVALDAPDAPQRRARRRGRRRILPFDTMLSTFLSSLLAVVLGAGPEAAALAGALFAFAGLFQHANVRTPRWLGYFIQRPEQHSVHHARGVHAYNYANLPLWDLAFGTFRNPHGFVAEAGFWDEPRPRRWPRC
jgi:hypothetical protein